MLKKFTFSLLSAAMLLSLGTGATFAQETAKATVKATKVEQENRLYGAINISWSRVRGATHYQISARNLNTDEHVIPEEVVPSSFFSLKRSVPYGDYRVWVGGYVGHPKYGGRLLLQDQVHVTIKRPNTSVRLTPNRP
ncbi:hypothetical protein [Paenibacillus sp. 481]|uniref:hypothetical protein n=1 Tax=Paenibacillus sp. 481 TaxID=2835869 RepID=UPI001E5BE8BC|nr:hypothetical protein [Paenibacillus sp. 481]UHA75101.1 hypothetical protein KIK04_08795 [Paenibacillus sp. 481]